MHRFLYGAESGRALANLQTQVRNLCRATGKLVAVAALIGFFLVVASLIVVASPSEKRPLRLSWLTHKLCRFALTVLNIELEIEQAAKHYRSAKGALIVANHLSYLDILILSACLPTLYVTSVEIQKTPGLGWIASLGGCLFVERRRKLGLPAEIAKVQGVLDAGINLTIFPEGTSSNGETVLPFKSALLHAAIASRCTLQPVCLKYLRAGVEPVSKHNREAIYWYGDMGFFEHLRRFVQLPSLKVRVSFLESQSIDEETTRGALAKTAHDLISERYHERGRSAEHHAGQSRAQKAIARTI